MTTYSLCDVGCHRQDLPNTPWQMLSAEISGTGQPADLLMAPLDSRHLPPPAPALPPTAVLEGCDLS